MNKEEIIKGVIEFVLKREKEDGGFGGTRLLPPTIEDTYFAVNTLSLCNYPVNIEKHKKFLLNQNLKNLTLEPIAKLFKLLNNWNLLGELDKKSISLCKKRLKNRLKKKKIVLKELKNLLEIFLSLKEENTTLTIKNRVLKDLQKIPLRTLKDYYFLCKILEEKFPKDFLEFVLEAQNSDGGFGFFKGTTSYMENTYYACYILHSFNFYPKNQEKLKEFILSCRNKDGGFGRNSQGISFLESTYHAFWILKNYNFLTGGNKCLNCYS